MNEGKPEKDADWVEIATKNPVVVALGLFIAIICGLLALGEFYIILPISTEATTLIPTIKGLIIAIILLFAISITMMVKMLVDSK